MKTLTFSIVCAAVIAAFNFSSSAIADTVVVHHDAWTHDDHGYWDANAGYHPFIVHEHHHGYWRERNGARVFINVD